MWAKTSFRASLVFVLALWLKVSLPESRVSSSAKNTLSPSVKSVPNLSFTSSIIRDKNSFSSPAPLPVPRPSAGLSSPVVVDGLIAMRAREELNKEDFQRRMEDAQKEKKRLEELLADTGDQIDKRIKFANEA